MDEKYGFGLTMLLITLVIGLIFPLALPLIIAGLLLVAIYIACRLVWLNSEKVGHLISWTSNRLMCTLMAAVIGWIVLIFFNPSDPKWVTLWGLIIFAAVIDILRYITQIFSPPSLQTEEEDYENKKY